MAGGRVHQDPPRIIDVVNDLNETGGKAGAADSGGSRLQEMTFMGHGGKVEIGPAGIFQQDTHVSAAAQFVPGKELLRRDGPVLYIAKCPVMAGAPSRKPVQDIHQYPQSTHLTLSVMTHPKSIEKLKGTYHNTGQVMLQTL